MGTGLSPKGGLGTWPLGSIAYNDSFFITLGAHLTEVATRAPFSRAPT